MPQPLVADPDLKLVSERSTYVRTERSPWYDALRCRLNVWVGGSITFDPRNSLGRTTHVRSPNRDDACCQ